MKIIHVDPNQYEDKSAITSSAVTFCNISVSAEIETDRIFVLITVL